MDVIRCEIRCENQNKWGKGGRNRNHRKRKKSGFYTVIIEFFNYYVLSDENGFFELLNR